MVSVTVELVMDHAVWVDVVNAVVVDVGAADGIVVVAQTVEETPAVVYVEVDA